MFLFFDFSLLRINIFQLKSENRGVSPGSLHSNLAIVYDQLGDSTRSLHHFEQSVSSCEKEKRKKKKNSIEKLFWLFYFLGME